MESNSGGGVGLFGMMFLIFLVLKLTGTITWSWWAVTAPLWGPAVGVVGILALAFTIGFMWGWVNEFLNPHRRK